MMNIAPVIAPIKIIVSGARHVKRTSRSSYIGLGVDDNGERGTLASKMKSSSFSASSFTVTEKWADNHERGRACKVLSGEWRGVFCGPAMPQLAIYSIFSHPLCKPVPM